ncbi:MAG: DEAD/DEAH box helicase [Clostridia bacterium]|nr:DEAD/DEAH box helicase [Clostridia bacterium]
MTETKFFGGLELSKRVHHAIMDMGFEEPSPIQTQAIPLLMQGKDVIGQAQTGTGKTAAFGIPIVEMVNPRLRTVQALVLTPTRELAIQVAEEIAKIGRLKGIRTLPVYGGQPIDRQIKALRQGVQVVIGTPGRLLDHISRKTLRLDRLQIVVLDEADEMLDMGFIEDIESILQETPEERQTLLFSATMPDPIQRLARRYLRQPEWITVSRDELTVPSIEQVYYEVREKDRLDALCRIIDSIDMTQVIIFCRTKKGVDDLMNSLQARGYGAEGLHGDLSQSQRDRVMKKFREGTVEILVATDVAARGIDVDNVSHVVNYEVPQDPESYVHRIGRTGRAGRSGVAITLILPREYRQLRLIEKLAKTSITRTELPSLADIAERQKEVINDKLRLFMEEGSLDIYRRMVEDLVKEFDPLDIAAAALKLNLDFGEDELETESGMEFGNTGARPGMVRFFMNVGRQDNVGPREMVQFISEEAGVPGSMIGNIKLHDRFSFVEVRDEVAEKVFYCLQRTNLRGRRVNVEPAKGRSIR